MITTNYYNYLRGISTQAPPTSDTWVRYTFNLKYVSPVDDDDFYDDNGNSTPHAQIHTSMSDPKHVWCIRDGLVVTVGTGTTSPTRGDFKLENDVTASFSNYSTTVNVSVEDGKYVTTISFGGTNSTSSNITLTEFGICKQILVNYVKDGTYYSPNILFVHEIFKTPIVVSAYSGFTRTITWVEE